MTVNRFWKFTCLAAVMVVVLGAGAWAQFPSSSFYLNGLVSDYTPVTGVNGPWEMRGEWSAAIHPATGTASFSATLNMTHSDYWVMLNPGSADDNTSAGRHPHTHLITISHGTVTLLPNGGVEITGPVYVTNDGNAAPFMPNCTTLTPCILTVDITGGALLPLSNMTMTFSGPPKGPTVHFGTQPIHGFVRRLN